LDFNTLINYNYFYANAIEYPPLKTGSEKSNAHNISKGKVH